MDIETVSYKTFIERHRNDEGIVLIGTGGSLQEWLVGVTGLLVDGGIADGILPEDLWSRCCTFTTDGGCTNLALVFNPRAKIDIGKLAIWRLKFGDCMWISDYVANAALDESYV